MTDYRETLAAGRRATVLRLVKSDDGRSDKVLHIAVRQLGFSRASLADVKCDLEWLAERGLINIDRIDMLDSFMLIARITDKGRDAAAGRGDPIDGLESPE